jgi:hypothetical protein
MDPRIWNFFMITLRYISNRDVLLRVCDRILYTIRCLDKKDVRDETVNHPYSRTRNDAGCSVRRKRSLGRQWDL